LFKLLHALWSYIFNIIIQHAKINRKYLCINLMVRNSRTSYQLSGHRSIVRHFARRIRWNLCRWQPEHILWWDWHGLYNRPEVTGASSPVSVRLSLHCCLSNSRAPGCFLLKREKIWFVKILNCVVSYQTFYAFTFSLLFQLHLKLPWIDFREAKITERFDLSRQIK